MQLLTFLSIRPRQKRKNPLLIWSQQKAKKGFALITTLLFSVVVGGLLIHWYQQTIQHRSQSDALLQRQLFFQELNGATTFALQNLTTAQWSTLSTTKKRPLPADTFPDQYSSWSATTSPLKNGHLDLHLNYQQDNIDLHFSVFLFHQQIPLANIPWVSFQSYPDNFPNNLVLSTKDMALVHSTAKYFWLAEEDIKIPFTHTFPTHLNVLVDNKSWSVENGPTILLDENKSIQVQGNLKLRFAEQASNFSREPSVLTVEVWGNVILEGNFLLVRSGQINGYFHIQGKECLQFNDITEVFWKGSLACNTIPNLSAIVRIQHETPAEVPALQREVLQFDGVRLDAD